VLLLRFPDDTATVRQWLDRLVPHISTTKPISTLRNLASRS
jgi:hypothetical protein